MRCDSKHDPDTVHPATLLATLTASILLLACGENVTKRSVDPPVDYGDELAYVPEGTPTVDVGFYNEQLYKALGTGDTCPIVFGLQGGTWTMPAVRIIGIASPATVVAELRLDAGEVLGQVESRESFFLATDGWLEIQALAVPAQHAPPRENEPIDDVFGKPAKLKITVTDDDARSGQHVASVILGEG